MPVFKLPSPFQFHIAKILSEVASCGKRLPWSSKGMLKRACVTGAVASGVGVYYCQQTSLSSVPKTYLQSLNDFVHKAKLSYDNAKQTRKGDKEELSLSDFNFSDMTDLERQSFQGGGGSQWTRTSLILVGMLFTSFSVWVAKFKRERILWYRRLDAKTGTYRSYNAQSGVYLNDDGALGAEMSKNRINYDWVAAPVMRGLQKTRLYFRRDNVNSKTNDITKLSLTGCSPAFAAAISDELSGSLAYIPRAADGSFSILDVTADETVHTLIDVMVRHKHLERSGRSRSSIHTDKVLLDACRKISMTVPELQQRQRDVEKLILSRRKNPTYAYTYEVKDVPLSTAGIKGVYGMWLLVNHLELLEQAYKTELGYVLSEQKR